MRREMKRDEMTEMNSSYPAGEEGNEGRCEFGPQMPKDGQPRISKEKDRERARKFILKVVYKAYYLVYVYQFELH